MAGKKLKERIFKLVKKATNAKQTRQGVKEIQKALNKNEKGVLILAGNVSPIDVITHLPLFAEEKEVPFVFVEKKEDLGAAAGTKRSTSCILVLKPTSKEDPHAKYYRKVHREALQLRIDE